MLYKAYYVLMLIYTEGFIDSYVVEKFTLGGYLKRASILYTGGGVIF